MTRTPAELDRLAVETDELMDRLDPATLGADQGDDLRAIAVVVDGLADGERRLTDAVGAARANGRSWGQIALALGVKRQSAHQRFGHVDEPTARLT